LTRAHRSVESTATLGSFTVQDGGGGMIIRPNDTSAGELVWVKHQVKGNGDEVATNVGLGGIEVLCDVGFAKRAVDWFAVDGLRNAPVEFDADEVVVPHPEILENTMAPGEFDAFYDADDVAGGGDVGMTSWGVERSMREAWRSKVSKNITHNVSLLLNAPTLIFPHPDNGCKVILDMGRFKLTNKETDTEVVKGIMAKEGVSSDAWEEFALKLTDFALILDSNGDRKALLSPATSIINVGVEKKTSSKGVLACSGLVEGLDVRIDIEAWEVLRGVLASWDDTFSPSQQASSLDVDLDSISVTSSVRDGVKDRHLRAEKAIGVTKNQSSDVVVVGVFSLPTITMSLSPAVGKTISVSLKGLSSAIRLGGTCATIEGAMGGVTLAWTDEGAEFTLMESGKCATDKLASVKVSRNERLDETDIIARFECMQVNYNAERVKEILGYLEKLKGGDKQQITFPPSPPASRRQSPTRRSNMMPSVSSMSMVGSGIVGGIGIVRNSDEPKANKTVLRIS
ncbi:hypothetical protein TrRE_jg13507, partial [Triparma retinervis]